MARPKAQIDWSKVGKLCQAGCSGVGIASQLGIDEATLRKRCEQDNKVSFSEFRQLNLQSGNDLLKAKQFELAMKGDKTMLVWLGKQRLGQTDKAETRTDGETKVTVRYVDGGTDAEHS